MTAAISTRLRIHPMPAASAYWGTVRHRRFGDTSREFEQRLFLAFLDLDELPRSLDRLPMWSARRLAPLRFRRRDYFDGSDRPISGAVRDLVQERLGRRPRGRIHLLAHVRTLGFLFNPLAVYYCWTADGNELDALVLEVTNTPWSERCWYVIDALAGARSARTPKAMHVSPFLPMDLAYDVSWSVPSDELNLRIGVEHAGLLIFEADLALTHATLKQGRATTLPIRYPLMPLLGLVAIYREALRLLLRHTSVYPHPASRQRQPR